MNRSKPPLDPSMWDELSDASLTDAAGELIYERGLAYASRRADTHRAAAGVIGNFERMTRIADATGIPLDAPSALASSDFRGTLGLDRYGSARNTKRPGIIPRLLAPLLAPAPKRC